MTDTPHTSYKTDDTVARTIQAAIKASPARKKVVGKVFRKIVKATCGRHYGVDSNGTLWRLDRLDKKKVPYRVGKAG